MATATKQRVTSPHHIDEPIITTGKNGNKIIITIGQDGKLQALGGWHTSDYVAEKTHSEITKSSLLRESVRTRAGIDKAHEARHEAMFANTMFPETTAKLARRDDVAVAKFVKVDEVKEMGA